MTVSWAACSGRLSKWAMRYATLARKQRSQRQPLVMPKSSIPTLSSQASSRQTVTARSERRYPVTRPGIDVLWQRDKAG